MKQRVNRALIDFWIRQNSPGGLEKLAEESGVSGSMISKIRTGRVPVKAITRGALAEALGTDENLLFPPLARRTGKSG